MKNQTGFLIQQALILAVLMIPPIAYAQGGCGGHGGDTDAQEFFQAGESWVTEIESLPTDARKELEADFSLDELRAAVAAAVIVPTDQPVKVLRDGREIKVEAKNETINGSYQITLHRPSWARARTISAKARGLALHEYLGVVKAMFPERGEWDAYSASTRALALSARHREQQESQNVARSVAARTGFAAAKPLPQSMATGLVYSCVERSLRLPGLNGIARANRIASAVLARRTDPFEDEWEAQTRTRVRLEWRLDASGDIYALRTDQEAQAELSVLYCPKVGSEGIARMRFMKESLDPMLDVPDSEGFRKYRNEIAGLTQKKAYNKCDGQKSLRDCFDFLRLFASVRLEAETVALRNAKANINRINEWINSLGELKFVANAGLLEIFERYTTHQDYLQGLLNLGDGPYLPDGGLAVFLESLDVRLPQAYRQAKRQFAAEAARAEARFILGFDERYQLAR